MSLGICPASCEPCEDTECYVAGCRYADSAILVVCEQCGELHVAFLDPPICRNCLLLIEGRPNRKR